MNIAAIRLRPSGEDVAPITERVGEQQQRLFAEPGDNHHVQLLLAANQPERLDAIAEFVGLLLPILKS